MNLITRSRSSRKQWLPVFVIALASAAGAQADVDSGAYRVGVSTVDITPSYPIRLNGFGFRRDESAGVSQRIHARSIAISYGDQPPLVLIAIDSLGIRTGMVDDVARQLESTHGIPRDNIAITFTHSHCTPKVNGASDNIFSEPIPADHQVHIDRYTSELSAAITRAATAAIADQRPARLEWAIGTVGFAKNRRTPGGPVDHSLPTLVVRNIDNDDIRAIYVSYACHCVTLSFNQISGDWAGYAAEMLERRYPTATALVSIGAGSDSNPDSGVTGDKTDIAETQGVQIAAEVDRLLQGKFNPIHGKPTAVLNTIPLPLNALPTRIQLETLAAQGGPSGYNARTQLQRLDRGEELLSAIHYPIQTWTFGDSLSIVFLAGEVCVDYALRLKRELNRDRLWINAYSNDFCSYIPSERLVGEGGYGGGAEVPYFALPTTLKGGLEELIVAEVHRQVPADLVTQAGTQGVPPKSPEDSMRCMTTHGTLRIELAAAEPLISDPVAIDFGPDGRLWVAEMNDYGQGVYESFEQHGRIRVLSDTDSDGRFDDAVTFVEGLRFPTDVKIWRDGVIVCDAPDIVFARDTNNDGKADSVTKLFSGFEVQNAQARVNSLRWGVDNSLYGSCGLFGGEITSHITGERVDVRNRDFRIDPDRGLIEPVTGRTQQGRCRTDWSDWFGCSNGTLIIHYPTDDRYARRNPWISPPPSAVSVTAPADTFEMYPPQNLVRFELSGPPGRATSACGIDIYRDTRLGTDFVGNALTCEPVHQLVHRIVLEPDGLRFNGHRAADETDSEFLISTDQWFRPVQVRTGPDGAIWVVDMYRYVIEHSRWIPQSTLDVVDVYAGQGRGRIYRIIPANADPAAASGSVPMIPVLTNRSPAALASLLDSTNGTVRDLVHQMLLWQPSADAVEPLRSLIRSASQPQARMHALAVLIGLNAVRPEDLLIALKDTHSDVLRHAVLFSEPYLDTTPSILNSVLRLAEHDDVRIRRQVAWSLGASVSIDIADTLAQLAGKREPEPWVQLAALSSVSAGNVSQVLNRTLSLPVEQRRRDVVSQLVSVAVRIGDPSTVKTAINTVLPQQQQLGNRLRDCNIDAEAIALVLDTIDQRAGTEDVSLSPKLLRCIGQVHAISRRTLELSDVTDAEIHAAFQLLGRESGPVTQRAIATTGDAIVSLAPEVIVSAVAEFVSTRFSQPIQDAAIETMDRIATRSSANLLMQRFEVVTPTTQLRILDTLLARDDWAADLLAAVESKTIRPTAFDASRRQRLLTHDNETLQLRARAVFDVSSNPARTDVVIAHENALTLNGDVDRGRTVFRRSCAACHQLEATGHVVGPDLKALTNRDPRWLLTTILDPNRDVDARYVSWTAVRDNGQTTTGLLVEESSSAVRLREAGGREHVIPRRDLAAFKSSQLSVMPEGLERDLTSQDLADVIKYVAIFDSSPKVFSGNTPARIEPTASGELRLRASQAAIRGGDIVFETPFQNIGYWSGESDRASWDVNVPADGLFDVYLDFACANQSAGNRFRIDGINHPVQGTVRGSGGWESYRQDQVATVTLRAGLQQIIVRSDGPVSNGALFDLRELRFVPAGTPTNFASAQAGDGPLPRRPPEIAPFLLDENQATTRRQAAIDARPGMGPAIVKLLVADLKPNDAVEEYRRIPWIWRVAIAVGKRNDGGELRDLLDVSLPQPDQPLRDWQAVVIGGGIVNGIGLTGHWPHERITDILAGSAALEPRWQRALELAATMADDTNIRPGTRYDALRMIALRGWNTAGPQLLRYLTDDVSRELQMGAVSGLSDIPSEHVIEPLIASIPHLSEKNRRLALEALLRTETRTHCLLDAMNDGKIDHDKEILNVLKENASDNIRHRVKILLMP